MYTTEDTLVADLKGYTLYGETLIPVAVPTDEGRDPDTGANVGTDVTSGEIDIGGQGAGQGGGVTVIGDNIPTNP